VSNRVHSAKGLFIPHFRCFYSFLFVHLRPSVTTVQDVHKRHCIFVNIDKNHRSEGSLKTILSVNFNESPLSCQHCS
jgi:hypothetical protein